MTYNRMIWVITGLLLLGACRHKAEQRQLERYVVVLSMDGFRNDYPDRTDTPHFDSIAKTGVRAALIPCFPSVTFPNHYSMATGLHPDHHGVVNNAFYDSRLQQEYCMNNYEAVSDPAFYNGEPVWVTAEKQKVRTATLFWFGSEVPIGGILPSICKKYDRSLSFEARADTVINWLRLPEEQRPHLIMWYIEEPDHSGHRYGPDGEETLRMVEHIDSLVGAFMDKARELPIYDRIDFIFLPDHGMAKLQPDKYVNLSDYMPRDSFEHVYDGVPTLLYPKESYTNTAYQILKKVPDIYFWRKEYVTARFVYGQNPRIGQLVVVPTMGGMVHFRPESRPKSGGAHGYDNFHTEMYAVFYGTGPSFRTGIVGQPIPNIHIYSLITQLLGIEPAPNDGTPEKVKQWLKRPSP